MEKTCSTCLFAARKITSFPCSVCIDNGRWQPNEETPKPITYTMEELLDKFSDIYLKEIIDANWTEWCWNNPNYSEEQKNFYWSGIAQGVYLILDKLKNQKK